MATESNKHQAFDEFINVSRGFLTMQAELVQALTKCGQNNKDQLEVMSKGLDSVHDNIYAENRKAYEAHAARVKSHMADGETKASPHVLSAAHEVLEKELNEISEKTKDMKKLSQNLSTLSHHFANSANTGHAKNIEQYVRTLEALNAQYNNLLRPITTIDMIHGNKPNSKTKFVLDALATDFNAEVSNMLKENAELREQLPNARPQVATPSAPTNDASRKNGFGKSF